MAKNIVITGSTRGIGLGLAKEFLRRGHCVIISGRSSTSVERALSELSDEFDADKFIGQPCDVGVYEQVEALWNAAKNQFGRVDIWVNNAGLGNPLDPFWEQSPSKIQSIIQTNLIGLMNGSHVAMRGMLEQGGGQIYNMEGFGSNGRRRIGLLIYGTSKYGVTYFTKGLSEEAATTPVQIGSLGPGIVVTDLLLDNNTGTEKERRRAQRVFNILGDKVETVAPFLVERMLANTKNGTHIEWLTNAKIIKRFLLSPFNRRNLFEEV